MSMAPRWSRCRRKERSAVTTVGAYLVVMRSAWCCTNEAMSLAEIRRRSGVSEEKHSARNAFTMGVYCVTVASDNPRSSRR